MFRQQIIWVVFTILASTSRAFMPLVSRNVQQSLRLAVPHESLEATISQPNRRDALQQITATFGVVLIVKHPNPAHASASPRIDVNNALAREFTAFPGLYPTIATKIVKGAPYKNKKDVYAILNEVEASRLKQYDTAIVIKPVDARLKQFKTSQICKYECGSRVSSDYRDEQIKAVQNARR